MLGIVVGLLCLGLLLPRLMLLAGTIIMTPIHSVQVWFAETEQVIPALWREKVELQTRVNELENELRFATDSSLSMRLLSEENQLLRLLLGASTSPRTAAAVIARPGQLPYDILQIDQGSGSGIEVGAPVYSNDVQVIGLVSRVYARSAQVTLFTTPRFKTTAFLGSSGMLVTIEGIGGGVARVSVPQGVPLHINDTVHIPSIQPGVYGRISYIENEPTDPQQFGYITSDVPLQKLRYVGVGQANDIQTDVTSIETYIEEIQAQLLLPEINAIPTATSTEEVEIIVPVNEIQ